MRIAANPLTASPKSTSRASTAGLNEGDLDWTKDRLQLRSDIDSTNKALDRASFDAYRHSLQFKIAGVARVTPRLDGFRPGLLGNRKSRSPYPRLRDRRGSGRNLRWVSDL